MNEKQLLEKLNYQAGRLQTRLYEAAVLIGTSENGTIDMQSIPAVDRLNAAASQVSDVITNISMAQKMCQ